METPDSWATAPRLREIQDEIFELRRATEARWHAALAAAREARRRRREALERAFWMALLMAAALWLPG